MHRAFHGLPDIEVIHHAGQLKDAPRTASMRKNHDQAPVMLRDLLLHLYQGTDT